MAIVEEKIIEIGYLLPQLPAAAGLYSPAMRSGNHVYTSGQLPFHEGKLIEPGGKGKINDERKDEAISASRVALLNALAAIKSVTGTLDSIEKIVKLTLYVASAHEL